jgi:hypothetical protein
MTRHVQELVKASADQFVGWSVALTFEMRPSDPIVR